MHSHIDIFLLKKFDQSRSAAISTPASFQKELWMFYWKLRTCCCFNKI